MLESPTSPSPTTDRAQTLLRTVVDSGLLRCAVPTRLGGSGNDLDALAAGAAELARHSSAAGWLLWAQRMGIEALLQSPNVALREHWLNDFLSGERAATLSPWTAPLQARDTGRGWLLQGLQQGVPNLQWAGFSLVAPLHLHEPQTQWVMLRSEEDGLSPVRDTDAPEAAGTRTGSLRLNQVFFREDEWLCGPDLPQRMLPVARALSHGLPCPTDWTSNTTTKSPAPTIAKT